MPPLNPVPYAIFEFPVTLPSCLAVATLRVPIPIKADDFDFLLRHIAAWREALIRPPGLDVAAEMVAKGAAPC